MNNDLDIWWSAYLAALAGKYDAGSYANAAANLALDDYKRKAAELEADDGQ